FAEWIFECLNEVRKSDVQRQLLINPIRHSIQNEHEMLCLTNHIQQISEQDIVDILIGRYIEPLPTDRFLEYTSQALHKFRPFWVEKIEATILTLLDNFIEDSDNDAQQFELPSDDDDDISAFTDKTKLLLYIDKYLEKKNID
ncbi:unnamed protein product, partial [Rotaria magnacalcarata]